MRDSVLKRVIEQIERCPVFRMRRFLTLTVSKGCPTTMPDHPEGKKQQF